MQPVMSSSLPLTPFWSWNQTVSEEKLHGICFSYLRLSTITGISCVFFCLYIPFPLWAHTMSPLVSCPPNPLISDPTAAMFSFATVVNYHIYPGLSNQEGETIQSEIEVRKWNHPEVPPALSPEFSVGYFKGSTNSANAGYVCISGYFILANFITALMSSMLKSSFPSKPFIFVVFVNN